MSFIHTTDTILVEFVQDILNGVELASSGEAIWKLIHALHVTHNIENPGKVLDLVLTQERQEGVAVGEGVAILHGCDDELKEPVLAMGILRKGVFLFLGGPDEEPVSILFLALSPFRPAELRLQVWAGMAGLLNDSQTRKLLSESTSKLGVLTIIREHENG